MAHYMTNTANLLGETVARHCYGCYTCMTNTISCFLWHNNTFRKSSQLWLFLNWLLSSYFTMTSLNTFARSILRIGILRSNFYHQQLTSYSSLSGLFYQFWRKMSCLHLLLSSSCREYTKAVLQRCWCHDRQWSLWDYVGRKEDQDSEGFCSSIGITTSRFGCRSRMAKSKRVHSSPEHAFDGALFYISRQSNESNEGICYRKHNWLLGHGHGLLSLTRKTWSHETGEWQMEPCHRMVHEC